MKEFIIRIVAFWVFVVVLPAALFMMLLHRTAEAVVASSGN